MMIDGSEVRRETDARSLIIDESEFVIQLVTSYK